MPYPVNFPGVKESHEIEQLFENEYSFQCRVCLSKWKRKPNHGKCLGVPIYGEWAKVPDMLVSETSLYRDHKRKLPEGALPFAAVRTEQSSFVPLYLVSQGNPNYEGKRKTTKPISEAKTETLVQKSFDPFGWLNDLKDK